MTQSFFLPNALLLVQVENIFCLGSPLAVFLALRGIRPQGTGTTQHFLPPGACKRLFNIYHPADPVVSSWELAGVWISFSRQSGGGGGGGE
jgi:hypothetical protein